MARGPSTSILLVVYLLLPIALPATVEVRIGAIFSSERDLSSRFEESLFNASMRDNNQSTTSPDSQMATALTRTIPRVKFMLAPKHVDFADSFAIANSVCEQYKHAGVVSVYSGAPTKSSNAILRSFSEKFHVPYISGSFYPPADVAFNFSLNMQPQYVHAILALRRTFGWSKVTYIVDGEPGKTRIQELLKSRESTEFDLLMREINPSNSGALEAMLRNMSVMGETNIMVDCSIRGTEIFFNESFNMQMMLPVYNYVVIDIGATMSLISPVNKFMRFTRGGGNITGLLVDYNVKRLFTYYKSPGTDDPRDIGWYHKEMSTMLAFDAADVMADAWARLVASPDFDTVRNHFMDQRDPSAGLIVVGDKKECTNPKPQTIMGDILMKYLLQTDISGITGRIQFDGRGNRKNVGITLVQMHDFEKFALLGLWNETTRQFELGGESINGGDRDSRGRRKHIIVTTIEEAPFLMVKEDADQFTGNDRYEGYCVDLADMLAEDMGFQYTIKLVKDGEYGSEKNDSNGNRVWTGMVGEVMRKEADLAIAPLTINADRQRVVAFSKPFMNIGISIMIKKPQKELPGPLSFLDPFSDEIWYGVLKAYLGLSVGLFIVARFSPTEWREASTKTVAAGEEEQVERTNDFSLYNSMWFSLGALMQQGTDIAPRAAGSRIVGGVWWFFTLIIISSYTANLAAFLTVERMVLPINTADELAEQKKISYGTRNAGSTKSFFKNSQITVFKNMWNYMETHEDQVMVSNNSAGINKVRRSNGKYAFLIESAMNEYVSQQKPCDTMKVGPNLDSKGYGIAAEYDSDLIKNVTLHILKYQEDGDLERLKTTWWIDKGECGGSFSSTNTENTNSLGLSSVAGIFYILISGLILAMVSAVAEYLWNSYRYSSRSKKTFKNALKENARFLATGQDPEEKCDGGGGFDSLRGLAPSSYPDPAYTMDYWTPSKQPVGGDYGGGGSQYSFGSFGSAVNDAGVHPRGSNTLPISQMNTPARKKQFTDV